MLRGTLMHAVVHHIVWSCHNWWAGQQFVHPFPQTTKHTHRSTWWAVKPFCIVSDVADAQGLHCMWLCLPPIRKLGSNVQQRRTWTHI